MSGAQGDATVEQTDVGSYHRQLPPVFGLVAREWELYATTPAVAGRKLNFIFFGGGTPSFLSTRQLQGLVGRLTATGAWAGADEIPFECEPGTLTEAKLAAIRELGVTRLSLGVANFDDRTTRAEAPGNLARGHDTRRGTTQG